jgi:hypothetical protein
MENKVEKTKDEIELERLLVEYNNIRVSLEKNINEIIKYAKFFEKPAEKIIYSKINKKDLETKEA